MHGKHWKMKQNLELCKHPEYMFCIDNNASSPFNGVTNIHMSTFVDIAHQQQKIITNFLVKPVCAIHHKMMPIAEDNDHQRWAKWLSLWYGQSESKPRKTDYSINGQIHGPVNCWTY